MTAGHLKLTAQCDDVLLSVALARQRQVMMYRNTCSDQRGVVYRHGGDCSDSNAATSLSVIHLWAPSHWLEHKVVEPISARSCCCEYTETNGSLYVCPLLGTRKLDCPLCDAGQFVIISLAVVIELRLVTDGRMDGHTDTAP